MVARILSGYSIRGVLNYNETKVDGGDAVLIFANRFAVDIDQLDIRQKLNRFQHVTRLNGRAKRNAMHIMLNFHIQDILSNDKLMDITSAYMKGIGFDEQPFLVYRHQDVSHPHIHIVTTNIQPDGSRIDFHNIGRKRSESVRKQIEKDFGLTVSQGRGKETEQEIFPAKIKAANYGAKPTKRSIYNIILPVLRSYAFTSLAEYNAVLSRFNVLADRGKEDSVMFERRGLVYSITDQYGKRIGIPIKASAFAGSPTLARIEERFVKNTEKRKIFREPLKKAIEEVFGRYKSLNRKMLVAELEKKGIAVIFRQNPSGLIYGLTFVDHKNRCVFNGSDLSKQYSAKAILERLQDVDRKLPQTGLLETKGQGPTATNYPVDRSGFSISSPEPGAKTGSLIEILFEKPAFEPVPVNPLKHRKKKKLKKAPSAGMDTKI